MTIGASAISITAFGQPANPNASSPPSVTPRLDSTRSTHGVHWSGKMTLSPGKIYYQSTVRFEIEFLDQTGSPIDPTTVTFETYDPDGVEATYTYDTDSEVTKDSTGNFTALIVANKAGRWNFRWKGVTSTVTLTDEGTFVVQESSWYDGSRRYYTD